MNDPNSFHRTKRYAHLAGWVTLGLIIWLVILPWLSRRPASREYIERLRQSGIDPSAMYYTELPKHVFIDHDESR